MFHLGHGIACCPPIEPLNNERPAADFSEFACFIFAPTGHQSWPTSFSAAHSQPQQAWGSYNQPISLQNLGHYPHADFNSHSSTSDVQQQVHADIMGFAFGQQPGLPAAQQQQAGPSSDRLNVYPGNIDPTILMHSSRSFVADSSLANALGDLGRQQPPESSLSAMSGGVQYNAPTAAPQFTTTPNERPQPDGPSLTQTQMESVTKSVREKGDPVVELSLPTQHRSVSPRDSSSLPHTARALLDETYVRQHPEKAARGLIETLSTANVPGKLPPHGAPSSKDVSVRATNPKQRQDIITGMRQNATKSYLRTWIESPLGRRILVSWLADTLPPKKLGDDEDDPSAQWSKTLLPLLNASIITAALSGIQILTRRVLTLSPSNALTDP